MEFIELLMALKPTVATYEVRKLHSALFLAQTARNCEIYRYSLSRGRVHSSELDMDLVFYDSLRSRAHFDVQAPPADGVFISTVARLLRESPEVLDAAATACFFQRQRLGDPSTHLSWYQRLPELVRARAQALEHELGSPAPATALSEAASDSA